MNGPAIAYFRKVATLSEMVDHIYGRASLLGRQVVMHVYSRELFLVIAAFRRDAVELARKGWHLKPRQQLQKLKDQLIANIAAYRELLEESVDSNKERYLRELRMAKLALQRIPIPVANRA